MIGFRLIGLFAAGLLWLTTGVGYAYAAESDEKSRKAETVVIPLDQIWALDMPGTRPMQYRHTGNQYESTEGPLLWEIRNFLQKMPAKKWPEKIEEAPSGFPVLGTGLEALNLAHTVLVKNEEPLKTFSSESEVSLVFFSYRSDWHTYLHRVEREGNRIEIRYHFTPHLRQRKSVHIALIPLGKLPSGKYQVSVVRSPLEQRFIDLGFKPTNPVKPRCCVCKSFSFAIEKGL